MLLRFGILLCRGFYFVCKLKKTRHKVVLLSRQTDHTSLDFALLIQQLKRQDPTLEVKCLCKTIPTGTLKKMGYLLHLLVCMTHLATATLCVVDSYHIAVSVLHHKKSLYVMQTWHALCAVKRFGYQTLDTSAGSSQKLAKIMRMHKGYDAVLAPSPRVAEHYEKGFAVPPQTILCYGLPRIDYILSDHQDKLASITAKLGLQEGKRRVLYAPTFRKGQPLDFSEIEKQFDFEHYDLIIKHHDVDVTKHKQSLPVRAQAITVSDPGIFLFDLYQLCDVLITDYSSAALEFSLLNKPIYFYLYDYETYKQSPGLNIAIAEQFERYSFGDFGTLMHSLKAKPYDLTELKQFKENYITVKQDGNCTARIAAHLLSQASV